MLLTVMWGYFVYMQQFVGIALKVCQELQVPPNQNKMIMRFCKIYSPQKIAWITKEAQKFPWWRQNPVAAFMKAVGIANKLENERQK